MSLLIVIPAVSGPYDLGNVVVRAGVKVDPRTAELSTVSDPVPLALDGIPLRTRFLQVRLDRPNFTINPTRCDPFAIAIGLSGDEGSTALFNSRFQVANCSSMAFAPGLSLTLSGGLQARGHPAIHAVLTAERGESNAQRVSVALPKGERLDNAHIGSVCTRPQFATDSCPASSRLGQAVVDTPLLDQPLRGPVFLRSSSHKLPDLALDLEGQIDIEISGRVDSANGRLRTTFEALPDAPISSVTIDLLGGSRGLLINGESLCAKAKRATVKMIGQNGVVTTRRTKLKTSCTAKAKRRARARDRRGGDR